MRAPMAPRSSCCEMNHEDCSGGRMVCDRVIVKRCACTWFGSEEAFEDSVRSTVHTVRWWSRPQPVVDPWVCWWIGGAAKKS